MELLDGVRRYYGAKYREFGDTARGMDWKDRASQYLRFARISRHVDWALEPSVLDVGCGNGELLAFCRERGLALRYRGLDVCEEMVATCRRRFGPESATLGSTADLAGSGERFDYVVASGTFNVKQDTPAARWRRYLHQSIGEMYDTCRIATIWNMMTPLVDERYDRLYYPSFDEVGELATGCGTRRFVIDHGYPLYEMTVALFKEPIG